MINENIIAVEAVQPYGIVLDVSLITECDCSDKVRLDTG